MTEVKGRRKEKKGVLKETIEEEEKGILSLLENRYQYNLCNFCNYVIPCLGKPALVIFFSKQLEKYCDKVWVSA